ncbi:MAG: conjugal transfer protein TraD [Pseudomonadota bacterium]
MSFRKARTKTLIQLGGLLAKSGFIDLFSIKLGQDLQKDDEVFEDVAALMGALVEMKSTCDLNTLPQQKMLWAEKGKRSLAE